MRIYSLALGAVVLCALTTMSICADEISPNAMHVQAVGAADPSAMTHFNVYLPLTHRTLSNNSCANKPIQLRPAIISG